MNDYNTKRNKLIIREYGRNVQKMVENALAVEDRGERNKMAHAIVRVMAQLNETKDPSAANKQESKDYTRKLWDHLYIMSGYKLDVDSPFPKPEPETLKKEIVKPDYNKHRIRYRTYGRNMENVIKEVSTYPEEKRKQMAHLLANDLKMMYLSYNRDSVNDALIAQQISELSNGALTVDDDFEFTNTKQLLHTVNSNTSFYITPNKKKKKKKKKKKNNTITE